MTRLTVSIMVDTHDRAIAASAVAAERGADLVELRVDRFTEPGEVASLVEACPLPCILTCRPTWEGGHFDGEESQRVAILEALREVGRPPAYIDVELVAYQRTPAIRQAADALVDHPGQVGTSSTGLILSSHDFLQRPADLYQRVEAMVSAPACRVAKLAWRARSLRDNLEAFELLAARHKPMVALCMDEAGLASRVLAKKFGGFLTFAAIDETSNTAPGQPMIDNLKKLYRWDALAADTEVFGVIGHPVGHSMSPAIHNAGFDAVGYNGVYLPMPIPSEYEHFKATVATWLAMPQLAFRGASVTIPHKANLLRFVREHGHPGSEVEPLADRIGAANTLTVRDDGSLLASNTDYAAALDAVCDGLAIGRDELAGRRVAVIGAGGAARAIVAGFANYGATVVIYNRSADKAEALATEFNGEQASGHAAKVVAARPEKLCDSCCEVFINCTPIGMHPNVDATPIPEPPAGKRDWGSGTVVFDTIYNPIQTQLLRDAAEAGCKTIPGTEMFVRQGAAQFEQWTGKPAPTEVFERVLREQLPG